MYGCYSLSRSSWSLFVTYIWYQMSVNGRAIGPDSQNALVINLLWLSPASYLQLSRATVTSVWYKIEEESVSAGIKSSDRQGFQAA